MRSNGLALTRGALTNVSNQPAAPRRRRVQRLVFGIGDSMTLRSLGLRRISRRTAEPSGFTMIELLVVDSLIVILATMGMAQYKNSVIRANEAVLKEDLFQMRDAIDQYYADKGKYPADLEALVTDGYVRKIPVDPFTKSVETWQTVPAEPDANNLTAEPGRERRQDRVGRDCARRVEVLRVVKRGGLLGVSFMSTET